MAPQSLILYQDQCSPIHYLQALLRIYPYDIEETMVFSLLESNPYPYPALLTFIEYARHIHKYHILHKNIGKLQLEEVFLAMCKVSQRNQTMLYTHQFQLDATLYIKQYSFYNPYAHIPIHAISFVDAIQLHIPASIAMDVYQKLSITKANHFIFRDISINADDFLALSIQIADCHGLLFIAKKYISLLCACASLYQINKPALQADFFLLYGLASQESTSQLYYDASNELYLGIHSGEHCNHFQYLKDMISALYSAHNFAKNDFAIRGSMMQLHFPQQTIGVLCIGVQRSGKSALCNALRCLCEQRHIEYTNVFDDHGVLHNLDNDLYATGSEIGAYVHIDDVSYANTLQKLSATVLLQEQHQVTHAILPFTSIEEVNSYHKVDYVFYLDTTQRRQELLQLHDVHETYELLRLGAHRIPYKKGIYFTPFWDCFIQSIDFDSANTLLFDFLTLMYLNDIEVHRVFTSHPRSHHESFYAKKARQLLQYILLQRCEKEDCEN